MRQLIAAQRPCDLFLPVSACLVHDLEVAEAVVGATGDRGGGAFQGPLAAQMYAAAKGSSAMRAPITSKMAFTAPAVILGISSLLPKMSVNAARVIETCVIVALPGGAARVRCLVEAGHLGHVEQYLFLQNSAHCLCPTRDPADQVQQAEVPVRGSVRCRLPL